MLLGGNGYHDYELKFDPSTHLASLDVDGVDRINNYGGYTNIVSDFGFGFSGFSGGDALFSTVQLAFAVPEGDTSVLMLSGLCVLALVARKRARIRH